VKVGEAGAPPPRREDWSRPGDRAHLAAFLPCFDVGHVDLRALVAATDVFYEYPMCDRDPLPRWSEDRVTLLGDAAHPMYPMGSNGASQAILDARAVARCLASSDDPSLAFAAYEAERRPLTTSVVLRNRTGGSEGVIDLVERLAPQGFRSIQDVVNADELQQIMNDYATAAGFAQDQVNRV
jgi:5-methylphenazine-1-carboxylate 1-monooxygenase